MGRSVRVDLNFDTFDFSVDLPLQPVFDWFGGIVQRNEASRARDRGEKPVLAFRIRCPHCGAALHFLQEVSTPEGSARACRSCRNTFPLGV